MKNTVKQLLADKKKYSIELEKCRIIDGILFKKNLLWVLSFFKINFSKKIHDQPFTEHPVYCGLSVNSNFIIIGQNTIQPSNGISGILHAANEIKYFKIKQTVY